MTIAPKNMILVVNTGSSSVKFQLFLQHPELPLVVKGQIRNLGGSPLFDVTIVTDDFQHPTVQQEVLSDTTTHETAIHHILQWIEAQDQS